MSKQLSLWLLTSVMSSWCLLLTISKAIFIVNNLNGSWRDLRIHPYLYPRQLFGIPRAKVRVGVGGGGGYVLTCRSGNQKAIGWYLWLNCEAIGVSGLGFPEGTDKSVKPWTNWWHYWRLLKAGCMTSIDRSGMCLHFLKKKTITHGLHKKPQARFKRRA